MADDELVVLDLHGAHDGIPYLAIENEESGDTDDLAKDQETQKQEIPLAILGQLFRVSVGGYAQRGPERRYADYIEDLFALPHNVLDTTSIQPRILLRMMRSAINS